MAKKEYTKPKSTGRKAVTKTKAADGSKSRTATRTRKDGSTVTRSRTVSKKGKEKTVTKSRTVKNKPIGRAVGGGTIKADKSKTVKKERYASPSGGMLKPKTTTKKQTQVGTNRTAFEEKRVLRNRKPSLFKSVKKTTGVVSDDYYQDFSSRGAYLGKKYIDGSSRTSKTRYGLKGRIRKRK